MSSLFDPLLDPWCVEISNHPYREKGFFFFGYSLSCTVRMKALMGTSRSITDDPDVCEHLTDPEQE
jgi:hypothetical protein